MKIIIAILIFCTAGLLTAGIAVIFYRQKTLNMMKKRETETIISKIKTRFVYLKEHLIKLNEKLVRNTRYNNIKKMLYKINSKENLSAENFLLTEESLTIVFFCLVMILTGNIYMSLAGGISAFFIPELILKVKVKKRREDIHKDLADGIDIIAANIEGGLSLSAALIRYSAKAKGEFAKELTIVIKEIQLGKSFEEAMHSFDEKTELPQLSAFINAIIQADKIGGSIKPIIKAQAEEIRQKRFQFLKKKAHEAPVKLLIPLMLFIFPVIFIILFAPIVIKLLQGI